MNGSANDRRVGYTEDLQAPGDLEAVRTFINTEDLERPERDCWPDSQAASGWLRAAGLLHGEELLSAAEVVRLKEFRRDLRGVLLAHNGEADPQAAWERLARYGEPGVAVRICREPGIMTLVPRGAGSEGVIASVLVAVYDAVRLGTWRRLKACRKHSCGWAFYDRSKNGSGTWCSMAVCGNREKARRRRGRAAATGAAILAL